MSVTHKPRPPKMVNVIGYDVRTDKEVRRRTIDIHNDGDRSWLFGSFMIWAVYSGVAVEVVAVSDDVAAA